MIKNEPINGLFLDENNPRFAESVSGQDDAMTALLLDGPSKLINLAKDIVEQGALNPTEIPIAVEEDGDLVVIEGNRRLASLKLLANPDLAKAAANELELDLVKRFKDIASGGTLPTSVDVFVATDRAAARHWIELRHTGENNGVGVLEWASWQANNFSRKRGSQADRATIFCTAIETTFSDDEALLAKVRTVRQTKLTTLGRLVADPDIRSSFGFTLTNEGAEFHFEPEDIKAGIAAIFDDLSGNLSVTDIKTKEQRAAYITDHHAVLPDRGKKLATPRSPGATDPAGNGKDGQDGGDGNAAGNESKPSTQPGKQKKPTKPEQVIFQGLKLPSVNDRITKLLKGAQRINIDDSPQIAAILIRVLLELVVSEGIEKSVVTSKEGEQLKKKVRAALLAIDPLCYDPIKRNKALEMAWTRTQDNDGMAVQTLHAFVHNLYGDPNATEVRNLSTTFRPVLEGIDTLIASVEP